MDTQKNKKEVGFRIRMTPDEKLKIKENALKNNFRSIFP